MSVCRNNDRYDISRNECATFSSAAEYLKRLNSSYNVMAYGGRRKFHSNTERISYTTRVLNTQETVLKGRPFRAYPKTAILMHGPRNECDQYVASEHYAARRARFYVIRRYRDTEVPR